jgi:hypothetical protein
MHGPAQRLIATMGRDYTVRNATGGGGGLDTPSYSDDGTLTAVLERRGMPRQVTDSNGEAVDADLELRAVPDGAVTIQPAGVADGYPTTLVHPDGPVYRVLDKQFEDGGVHVLTVVTV